jgi:hypothetical protein
MEFHHSYKTMSNTPSPAVTPTPRTDAETQKDESDHVDTEFGPFAPSDTVSADFARQLERELAEVRWQRDKLAEALQYVVDDLDYEIRERIGTSENWISLITARQSLAAIDLKP